MKKVKQTKAEITEGNGEIVLLKIQTVRAKLNGQKRIKSNDKEKYNEAREQLALFAASQHHLNDKLVKALARVDELEFVNTTLRTELAEEKRKKIMPLK